MSCAVLAHQKFNEHRDWKLTYMLIWAHCELQAWQGVACQHHNLWAFFLYKPWQQQYRAWTQCSQWARGEASTDSGTTICCKYSYAGRGPCRNGSDPCICWMYFVTYHLPTKATPHFPMNGVHSIWSWSTIRLPQWNEIGWVFTRDGDEHKITLWFS